MAHHILICGSGSVGKRHGENLQQLGCRVSCFDPRQDRLNEVRELLGQQIDCFDDFEHALAAHEYDGVVIGSPTSFHVEQSIASLRAGIPVLLEKPVSIGLSEARALLRTEKETNVPVLLGYTWRWWAPLSRVKSMLEQGRIGAVRHVQLYMSAHLADWHPWERYQDFFMSKKALGGGALLDESHWIDLMLWFFGMPEKIIGCSEKISDLDIETDDNVDIRASYPDGKRIWVHLDLYGRPHERFIRFVGEKGTLNWSSDPNEIRVTLGPEFEVTIEKFDMVRNDMFVGTAKSFLDMIEGGSPRPCTLEDGVRVMQVIEAVRESTRTGAYVEFE